MQSAEIWATDSTSPRTVVPECSTFYRRVYPRTWGAVALPLSHVVQISCQSGGAAVAMVKQLATAETILQKCGAGGGEANPSQGLTDKKSKR